MTPNKIYKAPTVMLESRTVFMSSMVQLPSGRHSIAPFYTIGVLREQVFEGLDVRLPAVENVSVLLINVRGSSSVIQTRGWA